MKLKVYPSRLPTGYTELDYIETTGSGDSANGGSGQYINTGFTPNQDSRIVCEIMWMGGVNGFGARSSVSNKNFSVRVISGKWQLGYGSGVTTGTVSAKQEWQIVDINKNQLFVDGEMSVERDYVEFKCAYAAAIGAIRVSAVYFGSARYRSCQMYDDGVLVRDFIPCKNAEGEVGMYDTVESKFYGNEGTGEFIAGSQVMKSIKALRLWYKTVSLPVGYRLLDYIETTGTQYINTGFTPNQDTRIICEAMYKGGNGIYGARYSVSSRNFSMRVINNAWQLGYGDGTMTGTIKSDTTKWHIFDHNKNQLYVDGELASELEYVEFSAPYPAAIGAIRGTTMYYGEGKHRSFKIYDNGVLVRDLIPCVNQSGEVGMYDLVTQSFYANAGTGSFIAGEEVDVVEIKIKNIKIGGIS